MSRPKNLSVVERNERILADWRTNPRQEYSELCARHCVDKATLHRVLRMAKVTDKNNRKPRVKPAQGPVRTPFLGRLGWELQLAVKKRNLEPWSATEIAQLVGLKSGQFLNMVLRGQAELTTQELTSISQFVGSPTVGSLYVHIEGLVETSLRGT